MLHLVQNSKKEIQRNRLVAKIRLIDRKSGWMKEKISDRFYSIESWPNYAIEILLGKEFGYSDRIGLATFLHGNGMRDKDFASQIFQFYNKAWKIDRFWSIRFDKFQALFAYLDQAIKNTDGGDRIRSEYWYYDVALKLTCFYDGTIRNKHGEKRTYFPLFRRNFQ